MFCTTPPAAAAADAAAADAAAADAAAADASRARRLTTALTTALTTVLATALSTTTDHTTRRHQVLHASNLTPKLPAHAQSQAQSAALVLSVAGGQGEECQGRPVALGANPNLGGRRVGSGASDTRLEVQQVNGRSLPQQKQNEAIQRRQATGRTQPAKPPVGCSHQWGVATAK